jgi:ABC-type transport system involved in multi-copper enzyme maturation permease subunit
VIGAIIILAFFYLWIGFMFGVPVLVEEGPHEEWVAVLLGWPLLILHYIYRLLSWPFRVSYQRRNIKGVGEEVFRILKRGYPQ